jgi:molecular chaperone DnaJ
MAKDLYAILELPQKASISEVKKAYKRLARKYHPDLNPGDKSSEDKFKDISEAYAILSDPEKKKRYDTRGFIEDVTPHSGGRGVNFEGFNFDDLGGGGSANFSDLFESFFQGAPAHDRAEAGSDIVIPVTLTLAEAFIGKKVKLTVPHKIACGVCSGKGRIAPSKRGVCPKCGGSGKEGISKGPFQFARPCGYCGGSGQNPGDICTSCGGNGRKETVDKVEVSIPAGVDTGSRVRVKGKGEAGRFGGQSGALYIETHIAKDKLFEREGPNLRIRIPLTFAEALLGAKIEIPTISGMTLLKIPPNTKSGQVFRLRGKGMPSLIGGSPGDFLVEVYISVPDIIDEKSKEVLREFERLNPDNPRRDMGL